MRSYFGIHTHTAKGSNIRLLDSTNRPDEVIQKAIELGLSGVAFTEHEFLGNHVEINQIATNLLKTNPNFKIGLGNEIYLTNDRSKGQKYYHFILIAKDAIGHRMLRELSSTSWFNMYVDKGLERVPTLKTELANIIKKFGKGHLIATSACIGGELSQNILKMEDCISVDDSINYLYYKDKIKDFILFVRDLFEDDFYIECAPSNKKDQITVNKGLYYIAQEYNIKMVVGTDAHYLTAAERPIHKAYLNSKNGEREVDDFYEFTYLMDSNELTKWLKYSFDEKTIETILNNTLEIDSKIEYYSLFHKQNIPEVEVKDYPKEDFLQVADGKEFIKKYPHLAAMHNDDDIQNRYWVNECCNKLSFLGKYNDTYLSELEEEARVKTVISEKLETNMFRYPNTLQHYIDMIWECDSMVGAGRGSSCAALNHYLLGITQLDPIKWNLPFFRYLNDERVELGCLILILPSCK